MLQLPSREAHLWCAGLDLPAEQSAHLAATLSPEERERSAGFRYKHDQQRFVAAHGVLRALLGRYLQTPPGRISYRYNAFGKPELGPEFGGRLKFNLSHSAGLALIAVVAESEVGVDLECVRTQSDYAEIARSFFSADEVDRLSTLPGHPCAEAILRCWTKKEAYLKACGEGLSMPLHGFSVPLSTGPAHGPVEHCASSGGAVPAKRWSFYTLQPAPGHIGALVIEGSGWHLSQRQWRMRQSWGEPTIPPAALPGWRNW